MVSDRSNGIYRSVFIALAGLILVGADKPRQDSPSNATTANTNKEARQHENISSDVSRIGNALEAQNAKTDPYEKDRNEREIRDLQAQENSAYWAEAMFWATVSALVLSFFGILLVWVTFRETRKTNDLSKRGSRAFVEPSFDLTEGNRFAAPRIAVSGANIGETTAQNAVLRMGYSNGPPDNHTAATETSFPQTIKTGENVAFSVMEREPPNAIGFYLYGVISYDCSFGERHHTYFCVQAEQAVPDPSIMHRGDIVFRPCKPADWPADT